MTPRNIAGIYCTVMSRRRQSNLGWGETVMTWPRRGQATEGMESWADA